MVGRGTLTPLELKLRTDISDNLNKLKQEKGYNQQDIVKGSGISQSTLSQYFAGKRLPSKKNAEILADFFEVPIEVIDPRLSNSPAPTTSPIQSIYDQLEPPRQGKVLTYAERQLDEQKNEEETKINEVSEKVLDLYQVEVVSETAAACGFNYGFGYDDTDREIIEVDQQPPRHDIATKVSGDSMQPDYQDGDILYLVDKGLTTYNGDLAVIAYRDRSYFKKIYTENGRLRLVSLNDKYEDIILDFPPAEDTHIKIYAVVGMYRGE